MLTAVPVLKIATSELSSARNSLAAAIEQVAAATAALGSGRAAGSSIAGSCRRAGSARPAACRAQPPDSDYDRQLACGAAVLPAARCPDVGSAMEMILPAALPCFQA